MYWFISRRGLMVTNRSKCDQKRLNKSFRSIFKEHGFEITIEKVFFQTNFLDIKLNLRQNIYERFRQENATIKYINNESNYPQNIRNSIKSMINQRLSKLSIT